MAPENKICPATGKVCIAGCYDRDGECFIEAAVDIKIKEVKDKIQTIAIESVNETSVLYYPVGVRLKIADLVSQAIKKRIN